MFLNLIPMGVEAARLSEQLYAKHDQAEPARIGAAYKLASIGEEKLAIKLLAEALYDERESVRRAAAYGLVAVGSDATGVFLEAATSVLKWVRKAGVFGLGDVGSAQRRGSGNCCNPSGG